MNHSVFHPLFEWPLLMCETMVFGLAMFAIAVVPASAAERGAARRRSVDVIRCLATGALIWAPIALLHQVAEMAGVSVAQAIPLVPEVLRESHAGHVWMVRIVALAALVAVAWLRGESRTIEIAIAALAGLLLMLRAIASHAIDKGSLDVVLYLTHEICAAAWIGALIGLWMGYAGDDGVAWFLDTAPRVSRVAGWCVGVIALTGLYAAYRELGLDLRNLAYSAYGRTLAVKVAVAALAIIAGGYNRFRLLPGLDEAASQASLRNNVAAEVIILAIVLGCSVVLAGTPPAH